MPRLNINNIPQTKSEMMNRDHKEFVALVNGLIELADDSKSNNEREIDTCLDQLLKHTENHFLKEEEKMIKTNFPPYPVHKNEHNRILKILKDAIIHWHLNRDRQIIKSLLETVLPTWLVQHISTMDSVTAQFLEANDNLQIS